MFLPLSLDVSCPVHAYAIAFDKHALKVVTYSFMLNLGRISAPSLPIIKARIFLSVARWDQWDGSGSPIPGPSGVAARTSGWEHIPEDEPICKLASLSPSLR